LHTKLTNVNEDFHGDLTRILALKDSPNGVKFDLSVSLNPFAPSLKSLLRKAIELGIYSYYPYESPALSKLAGVLGIDPDCLILTNGASEAISLLGRYLKVGKICKPEFSLYEKFLEQTNSGPLWVSNPKNPTGELKEINAGVFDESFYPMSTGKWSWGIKINAFVIGSFTKLWACPGIRVGYLFVPNPKDKIEIEKFKSNWSVSSLALFLIENLLDQTDINEIATKIKTQREMQVALLKNYGIYPRPSDAPYLFIDDATNLKQCLYNAGILTRDCSSFGYPDSIRMAVGNDDALEALEGALKTL
jgi:histidinol-phosphate/aromatic aminotransferase/cobyric acid decarboxylase-like protein